MGSANQTDKFSNQAVITVTESAANTLTFKKLETGFGVLEKAAWIVSRIEYVSNSIGKTNFNADGDALLWGISCFNNFSDISIYEPTILDFNQIVKMEETAVGVDFKLYPFVKDFSNLPGGGLLVPPNPIYLWAKGSGLVGAATVVARIWYTIIQLVEADYWQLVESRRVLAS